jgi:predicted N-acyltransferase
MRLESSLKAKVVRKIAEIPPQDWNSVFPPVLENYYFFKTLDESNFEQFSFFYIMAYDNNSPVGATSCFLMRFALDMTAQGPLKFIFNCLKKFLPNILSPKVLMCGLPMGAGRIGISGDSENVMELIYNCMEEIAQAEKASMIIFKDFSKSYDGILRPLAKKGFSKIESLPSTDMEINFTNFNDYLKTLSRSSREGLKRNFKKVDNKIKIDLEVTDVLEDVVLAEVHRLYLQTYKKQDIGLEKVPMVFFKNISRNMPKETKYFLWRIEAKLVAFAFCLISGDYFIDYYLGFDYSVAYQYRLYFVRFRDLIQWCLAHGIKTYEMGQTGYEAKRRLGFNFIRLYFYMKHRNPLLNPFFNLVSYFMKPENFDPVFKKI